MVSKDLKIEIRPIPNRNDIKKFSDNLEYFSQAHIIAPFVNPVSLTYDTGLSKEDIDYLNERNFPYDIDNNWTKGVAHPFWESTLVKTELLATPSFLFPGKSLIDFVKWRYLSVNNYIYSSEQEMLSGSKPEATHYIYNESIEIEIEATKLQKKNQLIRKIGELSLDRKRNIILILENEDSSTKDDNYLTVKFDKILTDKAKVSSLTELLEKDSEEISLIADIKSALYKNVLRKTNKGIFYLETNLGFSEQDVKEFLLDDENQEVYLTIKSKIK